MEVVNSEAGMNELQAQIKLAGLNPWESPDRLLKAGIGEIFRNIWDWLVENWPTILRIIMTIAPLLILDERYKRANS